MNNILEIVGSRRIIDFVARHKTRYNDIHFEKLKDDVVMVTAELWGRYDEEDKEYRYFYGPYGELESALDSDSYVPFNDETKEWFKMVYELTQSDAYEKNFIKLHSEAIIKNRDKELAEINDQIKQLEFKKSNVEAQEKTSVAQMISFVNAECKQAKKKNQKRDSLIVKAFFENMTEEERKSWMEENGFGKTVEYKATKVKTENFGK